MNRILKTATEKDELLAAMVAKPTTMPQWVTCFVADENKNYILNAVDNTATEVVEVVSTATQENFVLAEDLTAPCPVSLMADGKIERVKKLGTPDISVESSLPYIGTQIAKELRLYKFSEGKNIIASNSGYLTTLKDDGVGGFIWGTKKSIGSYISGVEYIDDTHALILYRSNAVVVTIDWDTGTITDGTIYSIINNTNQGAMTGGIFPLGGNKFTLFYSSASSNIYKQTVSVSGTTISSVIAESELNSLFNPSTYAIISFQKLDTGDMLGVQIYTTSTSTSQMMVRVMKISKLDSDNTLESSVVSVAAGAIFDNSQCSNIAFGTIENGKLVLGITSPELYTLSEGNAQIPYQFYIISTDSSSPEISPLTFKLNNPLISSNRVRNRSLEIFPVAPNKIAVMYHSDNGAVKCDVVRIENNNVIDVVSYDTAIDVIDYMQWYAGAYTVNGSSSVHNGYGIGLIRFSSNGLDVAVVRVSADSTNPFFGVLKESGTTGETKPVVLEGGVLGGIAGASLTPAKKVYYDVAAETLNQTSGFEIGVAIKSNSIKLK